MPPTPYSLEYQPVIFQMCILNLRILWWYAPKLYTAWENPRIVRVFSLCAYTGKLRVLSADSLMQCTVLGHTPYLPSVEGAPRMLLGQVSRGMAGVQSNVAGGSLGGTRLD